MGRKGIVAGLGALAGLLLVVGIAFKWRPWEAEDQLGEQRSYEVTASKSRDTTQAADARSMEPSAILFITLDTTRADHLGVYGYERPTSPSLDMLAARGVRVTRAISTMPTTDPAHLSMFVGQYPRSHGVRRNGVPLPREVPNLAAWAQERGYATAAFVSRKHVIPRDLGLHGFDEQWGPDEKQVEGGVTLKQALAWLDKNGEQPFFLWVHFFDPHRSYEPPPEFFEKFATHDEQLQISALSRPYTEDQIEALTGQYDGEIAYMDSLVGHLVQRVEALRPETEPPLIFVVGDHGEALGELQERHQYAFDHGNLLYQGIVRVPMFVVWDGRVPAGEVIESPVDLVDIPATLFQLMNVGGFETQGESFLTPGYGEAEPVYAFSERRLFRRLTGKYQYAVQDRRFKLILNLPEESTEFYDLQTDADEELEAGDANPAERVRLRMALDAWLQRTPTSEYGDLPVQADRVEQLEALGYVQ